MNKFFILIVISFLFSCKSLEIAPGSERVRVFETEPKGCLYVGEVSSVQEDRTVGTLETEMDLETRVDLRNKAHALGGNILVFLKGKKTNTLPGSSEPPKSGSKAPAKSDDAEKTTDAPKQSSDEVKTLVFLATVFKCPSSILNQ